MIPIALVAATVASYAVGWLIGVPALLPVLNTLASFPFMVAALRRGDLRLAVVRMLLWSLTLAMVATMSAYLAPWRAGAIFVGADAYRNQMMAWVISGIGAENTPATFIPQQLGHAAIFTLLALVTGGAAAMAMGAVLMNQMGTYVGSLSAAGAHPIATAVLGWHPWAVIRIVSFVTLGVVLSVPLLSKLLDVRVERTLARRLAALSCAGLVADIVLKTLFAAAWRRLLLHVLGW
jgi:hypothetical protein